jgi:predicted O-methyltransferase YrrM
MRSSYGLLAPLDYGDIFKTIVYLTKPRLIVEFGILDGFSLQAFIESRPKSCRVEAYDIFEEFVGNSAVYSEVVDNFGHHENVKIDRLNFYDGVDRFKDGSIDILHIDIGNHGETYEFAVRNYMNKLRREGLLLLEGGSSDRDNIQWMNKYKFKKIKPYLDKLRFKDYDIFTFDKMPSLTIIRKRIDS